MAITPFKVEKSDKAYYFNRYYFHCIDCGGTFISHKCDKRTSPYCGDCKRKHDYERQKQRNREKEIFIKSKAIDDFIKALEEYEQENWISHHEYGIDWSDIEFVTNKVKENFKNE